MDALTTTYQPIINAFLSEVSDYSIHSITDGLINATFKVTVNSSPTQTYILQHINTAVFLEPENIQSNIVWVSDYLKSQKYPHPVLEIIPTKNGKFCLNYEGDCWRMLVAIENSFSINVVQNPIQAFEVGAFFGEFYHYLNAIDTQKIKTVLPHFLDTNSRIEGFQTALHTASDHLKTKAESQIEWITAHQDLPQKWIQLQQINGLPRRLIHADPKISNVLFDASTQKPKAIIDWDTLMIGTILYDYGDMIRSYTNTKSEDDPNPENVFDQSVYEALTAGFLSKASSFLSPIEMQHLAYAPQVIVYIQALRFLTDYLNGNRYYHCSYPEQNLNRTINQLNLLKAILKL